VPCLLLSRETSLALSSAVLLESDLKRDKAV
jgi:hypothetical protein